MEDEMNLSFEVSGIPERVLISMKFVEMCNREMGLVRIQTENGEVTENAELHPEQEGVFRLALRVIGGYLSEREDGSSVLLGEDQVRGQEEGMG